MLAGGYGGGVAGAHYFGWTLHFCGCATDCADVSAGAVTCSREVASVDKNSDEWRRDGEPPAALRSL
jgi:hypothetical protein